MKNVDIEKILQNCPITECLKKRSTLMSYIFRYLYSDDNKPSLDEISSLLFSDEIANKSFIIVTHDDLMQIISLALLESQVNQDDVKE